MKLACLVIYPVIALAADPQPTTTAGKEWGGKSITGDKSGTTQSAPANKDKKEPTIENWCGKISGRRQRQHRP